MTFDVEKFKNTKFVRRTAEIKITDPDLLTFIENGAEPVWKVQSLSAEECARANDAKRTNRNVAELVGVLSASIDKSGGSAKEFAGQVAELLGVGAKEPSGRSRLPT